MLSSLLDFTVKARLQFYIFGLRFTKQMGGQLFYHVYFRLNQSTMCRLLRSLRRIKDTDEQELRPYVEQLVDIY